VPYVSVIFTNETFSRWGIYLSLTTRMLAWGFIMSLGYAAETFSFGEAFLKSDRVRDTACLLTDVQMPGVNGL
jgi:FixJ family two-component response regulator